MIWPIFYWNKLTGLSNVQPLRKASNSPKIRRFTIFDTEGQTVLAAK